MTSGRQEVRRCPADAFFRQRICPFSFAASVLMRRRRAQVCFSSERMTSNKEVVSFV